MAKGPGGKNVGRVSVRVVPDTSDFRRELKEQLERLERQLNGEIPFEADTDGMREKVARSAREAAQRAEQKVKFGVDASPLTAAARAFNDIIDASDLDRISINMNRFQRIMGNTVANAVRLRESLQRSTRSVVDLTRRVFNIRQHFQSLSQTARNLPGHIGRIRFAGVNRDVDRSTNLFRRFGRVANSTVRTVGRGLQRGLFGTFRTLRRLGAGTFGNLRDGVRGVATGLQLLGTSLLSVFSTILKVSGAAFLISVAGAAITAAWGIAATAIAAVPAALLLVAGPVAAVIAGMDGIKKAAEVLKPSFDRLKTAVSDTFEKGLRPAFESLKAVMPTVQQGLVGIAESLSAGARQAATFLSSTEGITLLEGIFGNIRTAIDNMLPGLGRIGTAFLTMANQRGAFDALTTAVNTFGTAFQNSVTRLLDDGVLQRAFSGLGGTLRELANGFVYLVENGLRLFAAAAPGVNSFLSDLTGFFNRFDWNSLGNAVGDVFRGLGEALRGVPTETFREIEDAFGRLGDTFRSAEFQGQIQNMVGAIPEAIDGINGLVQTFGSIGSGIASGIEAFARAEEAFDGFTEKFFGVADRLRENELIPKSWTESLRGFDDKIDEFLGIIPPKAEQLGGDTAKGLEQGFSGAAPSTEQSLSEVPGAAETALQPLGPTGEAASQALYQGLVSANQLIIAGVSTWALSVRLGAQKIGTAVTEGMVGVREAMTVSLVGVNAAIIAAVGTWALSLTLGMQRMTSAVTTSMALVTSAMSIALAGVNSSIIAAASVWALSVLLGLQRMVTAVSTGFVGVRAAVLSQLTGINSLIIAGTGTWALSVQFAMVRIASAVSNGMAFVRTAVTVGLVGLNSLFIAGVGTWALSVQLGMQRVAAGVTAGFAAVNAAIFSGMALANSAIIAGTSIWALSMQLAGSRMASAVTAGFAQIYTAVFAGMARANQAIIAGGSVWAGSVRSALSAAVSAANSFRGQFHSAGANLAQGLADGLNSRAGAVESAARRLANAAAAAARAAAQIRSPSRVFIQLGTFIGIGLAVGMERSRRKVIRSAEVMIRGVRTAAEELYGAFDGAAFGDKWASDMTAGLAAADGSVGQIAESARNRSVSGEWQTIVSSRHGVSDEVIEALKGWSVEIDRNGIAKLVNKSNIRKARRR